MAPILPPKKYSEKVQELIPVEFRPLFKKTNTAGKVQDLLDSIPMNFKQTHHSPLSVLRKGKAQCIEGAMLAAALFSFHGREPLLMDFQTIPSDEDHVIALFKEKGYWGAVSKTNHPFLRFRDPIYKTPRELALSYVHEYFMHDGSKSLRAYSDPFDLRRYTPETWVNPKENLWEIAEELDQSTHHSILPPGVRLSQLRPASPIELKLLHIVEWNKPSRKKKKTK